MNEIGVSFFSCSVSCCKSHKASSKCVPLKSTISQGCTVDMDIVSSRRKSSVPKQYLYPTVDTIRPEGLAMLNQPREYSHIVL
jgi:hypothetical protein